MQKGRGISLPHNERRSLESQRTTAQLEFPFEPLAVSLQIIPQHVEYNLDAFDAAKSNGETKSRNQSYRSVTNCAYGSENSTAAGTGCLRNGTEENCDSKEASDLLKTQLYNMMEHQHKISMTSLTRYDSDLSGIAFGKGELVEIALHRAADGSIWDTSYPLIALLCKQWFPWTQAVVISILVVTLAAYLSLILPQNIVQANRFRFTALQLRGGQLVNNSGPGIKALGFMNDGCSDEFHDLSFNTTVSRSGIFTVTYAEPISINGWWFVTQDQAAEDDPVSFTLERSTSPAGDEWAVIGSSSSIWAWSGAVLWKTEIYSTTTLRNATETFNLGVPWVWTVHRLSCTSAQLMMTILILTAAAAKHHIKAKWIFVIFSCVTATMNCIACIVYCAFGQWQAGFVAGGCFFIEILLTTTLFMAERYLRFWIGLAGIGYPIFVLVHYLAFLQEPNGLVGDQGIDFLRNFGLLEGASYLVLFMVANILRRLSRSNVLRNITPDWDVYNSCWNKLCTDEVSRTSIEAMHQFTVALSGSTPTAIVRQPQPMNTSISSMGDTMGSMHSVTNAAWGDSSLSHHLHRLFAQAAGLDVFLKAKVKLWALSSKGCLPTRGIYEPVEQVIARGEESLIRWAPLKTPGRALEKLYRSYGLDASRLLDCCRQSIYFEDVESIFGCLKSICSDEEVRIARICNRLHDSYNPKATAGYRHVLINLSIVNDDTIGLHLNDVICELQLTLVDFARMKVRQYPLNLTRSCDDL